MVWANKFARPDPNVTRITLHPFTQQYDYLDVKESRVSNRWREPVGAALFMWLGRCSSFMVFACGGSQVVPPLPPPPPPFPNIMGAIFLFVVAMIMWAIGDIVGTFLRDLDVLARQPHDPRIVYRFAQYIFKTFGMATREINNIGKATIKSQRTSRASPKVTRVGGAP
jgi:hypothetical protein